MTEEETIRNPKTTVMELQGGIANLVISLLNAQKAAGRSKDEAVTDVIEWLEISIIEPMKQTGE